MEQVGRSLTEDMVQFWNVLYEKVLLEFMYVNKLNWAVPRLEVMRGECSVSSSGDASRDDNSAPHNGDDEWSKKSNNTTSFSDSFNFSPASLSVNVEVEVEVEAGRRQIIPLGGMYNRGLLTVMYECMCVIGVRLVCNVCVMCVYGWLCICVCVHMCVSVLCAITEVYHYYHIVYLQASLLLS